jgi:hypothetical protein
VVGSAVSVKVFSWDEDLHPRDEKGRFIRTWRELLDEFLVAKQADDDFNAEYEKGWASFPTVGVPNWPEVEAERDRWAKSMEPRREEVEVARAEAEYALEQWLTADKNMDVAPPLDIQKVFYDPDDKPRHSFAVASKIAGYLPGETEQLQQRAFEKYAADKVRLDINASLRTNTEPVDPLNGNIIKVMDMTFRNARPTEEPATAYRGLSMANPPDVGDVIVDLGFSSMINNPNVAMAFALGRSAGAGEFADKMEGEPTGHAPVLVEVLIPAGSRIVVDDEDWETITPRGSAFEIVGRKSDGTLIAVLSTGRPAAADRDRDVAAFEGLAGARR